MSARHYIVCLDLRGRSCLVVGGGRVASEKVRGLLECDADVTVVAPTFEAELEELPVRVIRRPFRDSDVVRRFLVIAATDNRPVNAKVSAAARQRNIPCNVADDPELCSFILPAIVRRDPIAVAVSTGGASPALAQHFRSEIAEMIRPEHVELAERLAALRPWAKQHFSTYDERRKFFQAFVAEVLEA